MGERFREDFFKKDLQSWHSITAGKEFLSCPPYWFLHSKPGKVILELFRSSGSSCVQGELVPAANGQPSDRVRPVGKACESSLRLYESIDLFFSTELRSCRSPGVTLLWQLGSDLGWWLSWLQQTVLCAVSLYITFLCGVPWFEGKSVVGPVFGDEVSLARMTPEVVTMQFCHTVTHCSRPLNSTQKKSPQAFPTALVRLSIADRITSWRKNLFGVQRVQWCFGQNIMVAGACGRGGWSLHVIDRNQRWMKRFNLQGVTSSS